MARFTRTELASFRDARVPDLLPAPGRLQLLFVGINPGLWTAATQTHFAHPANRFYPALAGIIGRVIDPAEGMSEADRDWVTGLGIGITNLVDRATARADELGREELRAGAARLTERVRQWRPHVVAVAGVTAYRTAFQDPRARLGRQTEALAGAELWVVPNPSGLNAHETIGSLARAYAGPATAAGITGGLTSGTADPSR